MLWVIQEDIHAKNQHYDLFQALERLDIPFLKVQVNQIELPRAKALGFLLQ